MTTFVVARRPESETIDRTFCRQCVLTLNDRRVFFKSLAVDRGPVQWLKGGPKARPPVLVAFGVWFWPPPLGFFINSKITCLEKNVLEKHFLQVWFAGSRPSQRPTIFLAPPDDIYCH